MFKQFVSLDDAKQITRELIRKNWLLFEYSLKNNKRLLNKFYTLEVPEVVWKKFGFINAGRAYLDDNRVEMNINYLYSTDALKFVYNTFGHELAHILAYKMYGEENHKPVWSRIAKLFGDSGEAFHGYKTPLNKPRRKNQIRMICKAGCIHDVSKAKFDKFIAGGYTCTTCNHNMKECKTLL